MNEGRFFAKNARDLRGSNRKMLQNRITSKSSYRKNKKVRLTKWNQINRISNFATFF